MRDEDARDELDRVQQRFALAAKASGDIIFDWDVPTGRVTRMGDAAALVAIGLAGDGTLDEWRNRLHPGDGARVTERLREVLETGAGLWADEYRIRRPDGTYAFVSNRALIVRSRSGTARRVVGALHDVSDRKAAEEHLRRLQAELVRMSQAHAMAAAATMLAHELNQPLTAAANYLAASQLILSSMDGDLAREAMHEIEDAEEQIQRAGEIIRKIRFLNKRQEPKQRTAASLLEVTSNMEVLLHTSGACDDARISYDLDPGSDLIRADPIQVEQVLMNLILNACDSASPAGPADVNVSSRRRPDGCVEIRVRDNGPGIPEEKLQTLFTSVGVSTIGELGLGPSISRTIVEALGGSLWAKNNGDGGASFYFTVPLLEGGG